MPYIYRDELGEGEIAADVFSKDDYAKIINERDDVIAQRDEALGQISVLENALRESKQKYADTFLSSPARAKNDLSDDTKKDSKISTFDELFEMKGKYNAL